MSGGEETLGATRPIVYCVLPRDLAPKLHDPLRRHFRHGPDVEVVVEQRAAERRAQADRRSGVALPPGEAERRLVRSRSGRRVGERRATLVAVSVPTLPRAARASADRLLFLERLESTTLQAEDAEMARLVMRIQAGAPDAFAMLYICYFDRVYAYLRIGLADQHEAEDAAQQVFLNVLQALPRYEYTGAPFRVWLFTVVRNHMRRVIARRGPIDLVDPTHLSSLQLSRQELEIPALGWIADRELLMFIERLPIPQREVLVLRYVLDMSLAQVAAVLGRTEQDVRSLHSRALRFLRARLAAVGRASERNRPRCRRVPRQATVLRMRRFALLP